MLFRVATIAAVVGLASAECPNACSGHGKCEAFDMCTCNRNFQGNDCSLRTCPFDKAHVDTPKGDLDGSLSVTSASVLTGSQVYPYGTAEQFPLMKDTAGATIADTAHYYMECSNKGICDRKKGECECFEGYDGTACQRASCPNKCSGHGTCETISDLAWDDFNNVYALWDKDASMGCKCDAGYTGSDCAERMCKVGIDPLYHDDTPVRVQTSTIRIESSVASTLYGTYALKFYDSFGEDYVTGPIVVEKSFSNSCTDITAALKALPNNVIEGVECTGASIATNRGFTAELEFRANPGALKQMEVLTNLDGSQSSIDVYAGMDPSAAASGTFSASVYNRGVSGANTDYFASKCAGVSVTLQADVSGGNTWDTTAKPGSIGYLSSITAAEVNLLKACLGDSDGDTSNNVEVYNWDMGYLRDVTGRSDDDYYIGSYPHAIKTVPVTQTKVTDTTSDAYGVSFTSGGYHLLWWDPTMTALKQFRLANLDHATTSADMLIHTTDGVVQQLGMDNSTRPSLGLSDKNKFGDYFDNETRVVGMFDQYANTIYTNVDVSCETDNWAMHACVEKGDKLFVVDSCWSNGVDGAWGASSDLFECADTTAIALNTGNLYTVEKIYTQPYGANTTEYWKPKVGTTAYPGLNKGREDRFVIVLDSSISWDGSSLGNPAGGNGFIAAVNQAGYHSGVVVLFKFTPAATGNYEYVSQCSGRGACNGEEGLCECFKGYHGDACQFQSALVN